MKKLLKYGNPLCSLLPSAVVVLGCGFFTGTQTPCTNRGPFGALGNGISPAYGVVQGSTSTFG